MLPFFWFQYGFRSSRSTVDLLRVVSDRIARAFNRSGLLKLWHLIYPRLLTSFDMLVFFRNSKSYGISGQIFGLVSSFLSNRRLQVVLDGKSLQKYPVNAWVPQGSIIGPLWPSWWWYLYYCYLCWWYCYLLLLSTTFWYYSLLCTTLYSLISMPGKLCCFCLPHLITMVLLMWKWMGLFQGKIIF